MDEISKQKVGRWMTVVLVLCIVFGGGVVIYPLYQRSCALKEQEADLSARIAERDREIAALVEKRRRFRTDRDFVESIARKRAHRVFPGELVFIFEDD
ncbi:MAG TPA: hypothetical protein DD637_00575 [Verrucomicrobia bacterium]|nr:hypothetical protein [Verrucomicrobiota bacterium]HCG19947.1 hypothetical protein [Verrucomicrobiota bacterium]